MGRATRDNEVLISFSDREVGSRVTAIRDGISYHGETAGRDEARLAIMSVLRDARNGLRDEFGYHSVTEFDATGHNSDHTRIQGHENGLGRPTGEGAEAPKGPMHPAHFSPWRLGLGRRRSSWAIFEEAVGPDFIENEERERILLLPSRLRLPHVTRRTG